MLVPIYRRTGIPEVCIFRKFKRIISRKFEKMFEIEKLHRYVRNTGTGKLRTGIPVFEIPAYPYKKSGATQAKGERAFWAFVRVR